MSKPGRIAEGQVPDLERPAHRLLTFAVPVAATIVLVGSCVLVSIKKFFWNDELYSFYLLADPSLAGMLSAFHDAINNSPPLYFVVGWIWARLFGADELSLRLFSSLGVCVAFWLIWSTLRRAHGLWPATLGCLAVFCTSEIVLSQNAEARMYGLFLALCAAAVLLFDRAARLDTLPARTAIAIFLVHAGIVLTHLLGPLFSAGFLVAAVAADRRVGRFRPRAYLPIVAAWLTFLLYLPSFLVQADAGRPRSWLPTPTARDLLDFLTLSEDGLLRPAALAVVLLTATALALLPRSASARDTGPTAGSKERPHLVILALILIGIPVFAWLVSATIRPIFQDRYVIPATLGCAILLSQVVKLAIGRPSGFTLKYHKVLIAVLPAVVSLVLLAQPLRHAFRHVTETRPGLTDELFGHGDLPIVVQSSHRFLERVHYAPRPDRYFFILDWETAVADASGPFGPQEYKHLEALLRNYPERFAGHIVRGDEFLASQDRFLVLDALDYDRECPPLAVGLRSWDDIHCPQWLERRILGEPGFSTRVAGRTDVETLLLVERALPDARP